MKEARTKLIQNVSRTDLTQNIIKNKVLGFSETGAFSEIAFLLMDDCALGDGWNMGVRFVTGWLLGVLLVAGFVGKPLAV